MTHTADAWLIPSMGEARQAAIDRILAELHEQGRVPIGGPQETLMAGSAIHHRLIIAHQAAEDAAAQQRANEPPTDLEAVGEWPDGAERYDAPTGQAGLDLINERLSQLEAEGKHILSCDPDSTERAQSIRYHIAYRLRTTSEERVYQAIHGAGKHGKQRNKRAH